MMKKIYFCSFFLLLMSSVWAAEVVFTPAELAAMQGPTGPVGPQGPSGEPGSAVVGESGGICTATTGNGVTVTWVCSTLTTDVPVPDPDPVPDPTPIPPPSAEYARGVPYPDFGWNPLTYNPVTITVVSVLPPTVSAGQVIEYSGSVGGNVSFNCTQTQPCVLRGQNQTLSSNISASGQHFVIEGFRWFNSGGPQLEAVNFAVVRNNECYGDNSGTSNGTAMIARYAENVVYYRNTIRNRGSLATGVETDYHGFKPRHGNRNIWYLNNDSYELGGDSIQAGTNVSRLAGNPFSEVLYIARNRFHDNGENPIDIKAAVHVTISENDLYGARRSSSSSGEAIVIHESGNNILILSNDIHDSRRGVVTATSGGGATYILVDGNRFSNLSQYGVYNRGGGHADVFNNIFTNVITPIQNNSSNGSTVTESGNTIL